MKVQGMGITPKQINYSGDHFHAVWEIVLNLQGSGTVVVDGNSYPFRENSIICMPPYSHHTKYSDCYFKDIYMLVDTLRLPSGNQVITLQDDEENNIRSLFFMALEFFYKKEDGYQYIVNSLMHSMYQIILSRTERQEKNSAVERFKNDLIKNFTNPEYTLADAMKSIPYSMDHFRRLFKADTHMTPNEYFISLRMEYAQQLLSQKKASRQSISEIALLCGFYDAHYFSRVFKSTVGKTPKEFALENS